MSFCVSIRLSIYVPVYLSVRLPVWPSVCMCAHTASCISRYPWHQAILLLMTRPSPRTSFQSNLSAQIWSTVVDDRGMPESTAPFANREFSSINKVITSITDFAGRLKANINLDISYLWSASGQRQWGLGHWWPPSWILVHQDIAFWMACLFSWIDSCILETENNYCVTMFPKSSTIPNCLTLYMFLEQNTRKAWLQNEKN